MLSTHLPQVADMAMFVLDVSRGAEGAIGEVRP